MRLPVPRSLLSIALAAFACSDPLGVETDILAARIVSERLLLTNTSNAPVYYFAADRDILAVLTWAICTEPSRCNAVPGESTKSIALEDVIGRGESGEIVVFHWRLIPGQSTTGYVADSIRTVNVRVH
jgi:hypothetical protein